jgi:hypothetical protein
MLPGLNEILAERRKSLVLNGGPSETRTPDPLIKSSRKAQKQIKADQKAPRDSRISAFHLVGFWSFLRLLHGHFADNFRDKSSLGLSLAEECRYGREPLRRSAS